MQHVTLEAQELLCRTHKFGRVYKNKRFLLVVLIANNNTMVRKAKSISLYWASHTSYVCVCVYKAVGADWNFVS